MLKFLISEDSLQADYTRRVYSLLPNSIRNTHECYVVSSHPNCLHTVNNIPQTNTPKIIFDYADEWHRVPSYYDRKDVAIILKEYSPVSNFDNSSYNKLIPFVVAYNYDTKPQKQKMIKDRNLLLFSSMWLTDSRIPVQMAMKEYENRNDCLIIWNTDFAKGLSKEEYREKMRDAVITVCPSGYMSAEIAKIQEALVSGNIIITSERPKYHYYEGNPFLIYKDPREIPLIIETIAKMTVEEKQKIVDKGNVFYKERYSPDYFASLIEKRLF